jgi:hypothetical protein
MTRDVTAFAEKDLRKCVVGRIIWNQAMSIETLWVLLNMKIFVTVNREFLFY